MFLSSAVLERPFRLASNAVAHYNVSISMFQTTRKGLSEKVQFVEQVLTAKLKVCQTVRLTGTF